MHSINLYDAILSDALSSPTKMANYMGQMAAAMNKLFVLESSTASLAQSEIRQADPQPSDARGNKFRVIDYVNSRTCGDKTVSQNIGAIVELKLLLMEYAKEKVPLMNQGRRDMISLMPINSGRHTREVDFLDKYVVDNTLATYPIDYITNAKIPSIGPHLKNVNLLACDALCWLKDCHLTFVVLKLFQKWLGYGGQFWFLMNVIKVMAMIREVDFLDKYVAENTLAAYPIDYITNAKIPSVAFSKVAWIWGSILVPYECRTNCIQLIYGKVGSTIVEDLISEVIKVILMYFYGWEKGALRLYNISPHLNEGIFW
ncbi:phosphoenolpyruvate carboxykinase [Tanacetum coccineum]